MKQGIKNLLIFTAGAVTGTVATAFACRSFYIKYYNETITDSINVELDSIRDSYDKKLDEMEKKYQANLLFEAGMATVKEEHEEKKAAKKNGASEKKSDKKKPKEEAIDYTQFSKSKDSTPKTVAEVKKEVAEQVKKQDREETYLTNFESFTEANNYEKITLTYFAGDGVYVDEFENPDLDAPNRCNDIIKEFEEYGGDDTTVYARNDTLEVDFEIIYNEGTYAEWIKEG